VRLCDPNVNTMAAIAKKAKITAMVVIFFMGMDVGFLFQAAGEGQPGGVGLKTGLFCYTSCRGWRQICI
ncbi:MAG: hypothetical protein ACLFMU_09725, partial [Bacteroidales bacterium]